MVFRWGLTRDPMWSEFDRLRRDMDALFTSLSGSPRRVQADWWQPSRLFPMVNVTKKKDEFVLTAELPGMKREDLEIKVEGDTVSLKGERKPRDLGAEASYHRRERASGTFQRSLALPNRVDAENVKASYKNGVLTVVLPIQKVELPKQISVVTE